MATRWGMRYQLFSRLFSIDNLYFHWKQDTTTLYFAFKFIACQPQPRSWLDNNTIWFPFQFASFCIASDTPRVIIRSIRTFESPVDPATWSQRRSAKSPPRSSSRKRFPLYFAWWERMAFWSPAIGTKRADATRFCKTNALRNTEIVVRKVLRID